MVPIVVGDGTMSRREADGLCPICETAREVEQTRCRVCKIIIEVGNSRDEDSSQDRITFAAHHLP